MTRDEAIEIAARAAWDEYRRRFPRSSTSWDECGERTRSSRKRMAASMYDALIAAGAIPGEGTIPIARTTLLEWREITDQLPCHLSEMIDLELWVHAPYDAIPDAPNAEHAGIP